MSAKEYNLWKADYMIEPWGEDREDIRSGMIVQSIRAQNSKEGVYLKDCMVNFEPPKKQTWQEQRDMCFAHSIAMNKRKK
jgi:hypothetical protein